MLTAAIFERLDGVEGLIPDEEIEFLIEVAGRALAEQPPPAAVVEIGSYCGYSTIALASVAAQVSPESRVYAIDPHKGELTLPGEHVISTPSTLERFRANLDRSGVSEFVVPVVQRSYETTWERPVGLLFLDGLHDYKSVVRDYAHFEPWLVDGAYVALHDFAPAFPGVVAFVEFLEDAGYDSVGRVGSLAALRKPS
jgi:Methyltransferase domain